MYENKDFFVDIYGKWQPTQVFLPGEFCGQMSLAEYSPWGQKELTWLRD